MENEGEWAFMHKVAVATATWDPLKVDSSFAISPALRCLPERLASSLGKSDGRAHVYQLPSNAQEVHRPRYSCLGIRRGPRHPNQAAD